MLLINTIILFFFKDSKQYLCALQIFLKSGNGISADDTIVTKKMEGKLYKFYTEIRSGL